MSSYVGVHGSHANLLTLLCYLCKHVCHLGQYMPDFKIKLGGNLVTLELSTRTQAHKTLKTIEK